MSNSFQGHVLRKPLSASSNAVTSATPDTTVLSVNKSTYLDYIDQNKDYIEYLVIPSHTSKLVEGSAVITELPSKLSPTSWSFNPEGFEVYNLVITPTPDELNSLTGIFSYKSPPASNPTVAYNRKPTKLWYVRNDHYRRFDFHPRKQRWTPLKGSVPDLLGVLGRDDIYLSEILPFDPNPPILRVGEVPVPVEWVYDETQWPPSNIPLGMAKVFSESGEVLFASDILASYNFSEVYQFRKNFFDFDESDGFVGNSENPLFLNPIPEPTEYPLLRRGFGSYLKYLTDFSVNFVTGEVSFNSPFPSSDIYYDGVYSHLAEIPSESPLEIGNISTGDLSFTSPSFSKESLILYIEDTGETIQEIVWKNLDQDFSKSSKIPYHKVEGKWNENTNTFSFRVSKAFRSRHGSKKLWAGSGDFLLENGISFRLLRSPFDLSNLEGIPDVRHLIKINDTMISDSIVQGPTATIPQLPVQDIAGYDQGVFFKIKRGGSQFPLTEGENVVYDFSRNQIKWAERISNRTVDIKIPSATVKLPHEVLYNDNISLELNEGQGFTPLAVDEDAQVDFDTGEVHFTKSYGKTLQEGLGTVSGANLFSLNDPIDLSSFDFPNLKEDQKPLLVFPQGNVFRIREVSGNDLILYDNLGFSGSTFYEIKDVPETIFSNSLVPINLSKTWVRLQVSTLVQDSQFIPTKEDISFEVGGNPYPHVMLSSSVLGKYSEVLEVPSYFRESYSNFDLFRGDVKLSRVQVFTGPDQYLVSGSWEIILSPEDIISFPDSEVIFVPHLSSSRSDGPVEVMTSSLQISFPSSLTEVRLKYFLLENEYDFQPYSDAIHIYKPLLAGDQIFCFYYKDLNTVVEEQISFKVQETSVVPSTQNTVSFGASSVIDTSRQGEVYINGQRTDIPLDLNNKTVTLPSSPISRKVSIIFYSRSSEGGETLVRANVIPFHEPVRFIEGSSQKFYGDHTDILRENCLLVVNNFCFNITSNAVFDGEQTTVSIFPPCPEQLENPQVLVSKEIENTSQLPLGIVAQGKGSFELKFPSDIRAFVKGNSVLFLDDAPYMVAGISYLQDVDLSIVNLRNPLLREYSSPSIRISTERMYLPDTRELTTNLPLLGNSGDLLILKGTSGKLLENGVHYQVMRSGSVVINKATQSLPKNGEIWLFCYKGQNFITPSIIQGRIFQPKLKASYTRYISASRQNKIQGSSLWASYSVQNPDSYYFRTLSLEDYALEVEEDFIKELGSNQGMMVSYNSNISNHSRGSKSLIWEGGDLKDKDRVGRRFLHYYNEVSQGLETYLQLVDGRVIGDKDGQFKYYLAPDNHQGGDDPVSGELIPYIANPNGSGERLSHNQIVDLDLQNQGSYVRNDIEDLVLTSKKPFKYFYSGGPPFRFEYVGTYSKAWEPHRISRFYPQRATIATITPPSLDGSDYSFSKDFGEVLGDLKYNDVMSISKISGRASKAWINDLVSWNGNELTIPAGMVFLSGDSTATNPPGIDDPSLLKGDVDNLIPPFKDGDLINLGRIVYSKDAFGNVVRSELVYASNLKVVSVSDDVIKANSNGNTITTVDDKTFINGEEVHLNDTVFSQPVNFFRQGIDYGLDASEGELINYTLPDFIASIIDQKVPEPLTFLEVDLTFKNKETEPRRFPALDGEFLNDDGLTNTPYSYPLSSSEISFLNREKEAWQNVYNNTTEGFVENTVLLSHNTFGPFTAPLTDLKEYDTFIVEGETSNPEYWSENSTPFKVSHAGIDTITLACFECLESNVRYRVSDAVTGSGSRNPSNLSRWDFSLDFSNFSGLQGTLIIGSNSYPISSWGNGFVTSTIPISEISGTFSLSLEGVDGNISNLHTFSIPSNNFTSIQPNSYLHLLSGFHSGKSYRIADIGSNYLEPFIPNLSLSLGSTSYVAALPRRLETLGTGYIDVVTDTKKIFASIPANVKIGDFLFIESSSPNGGRYCISDLDFTEQSITVDRDFRSSEGSSITPSLTFSISRPRRFSQEVSEYHRIALESRRVYDEDSSADPYVKNLLEDHPFEVEMVGAPSIPFLVSLKKKVFSDPIASGLDGVVSVHSDPSRLVFRSISADFVSSGVLSDSSGNSSYIVLDHGYYRVSAILDTNTLVLREGDMDGSFISDYPFGSTSSFNIYNGNRFQDSTYELILSEYSNAKEIVKRLDNIIIATKHDPFNFYVSDIYAKEKGDPLNDTLQYHWDGALRKTDIEKRFQWITDASDSLVLSIEEILTGRENLYDLRFAWIDYRINMETGILQKRRNFEKTLKKKEEKVKKDLLRMKKIS